jgi:hypothetical protein
VTLTITNASCPLFNQSLTMAIGGGTPTLYESTTGVRLCTGATTFSHASAVCPRNESLPGVWGITTPCGNSGDAELLSCDPLHLRATITGSGNFGCPSGTFDAEVTE